MVAFEADSYGVADDPTGWSVLVRGVARGSDGSRPSSRRRAALPLESWAWDGVADRFVRIEPTLVTGRRVIG